MTGRDARALAAIGRAYAGALVFGLPMLMTMQMWQLGFYENRLKLFLLTLLTVPLLVGVSRYAGFAETATWREDLRDACVAYVVGATTSALVLLLFAIIGPETTLDAVVGKVALQAMAASLGALLARGQLGRKGGEEEIRRREAGYAGELFLMAVGALFLSLNVAPTNEIELLAYRMTPWHALTLALGSMLVMHGFVYAVQFEGGTDLSPETPWWSAALRFTVAGYALALLVSLYVLWTFGRTSGTAWAEVVRMMIVLGFPAAVGAAGARLII